MTDCVALAVIRAEHQALSALLRSLSMLLAQSRRSATMPDFELLRAVLLYIAEFPHRRHHPKESLWLFPALRRRAPHLSAVIDRLEADHHEGEQTTARLMHTLLAFEVLGERRRADFERAVQDYTAAYLEHMALEEQELLPAAEALLDSADRAALDSAFKVNRDPLTGLEPDDVYAPLWRRILALTPAHFAPDPGA